MRPAGGRRAWARRNCCSQAHALSRKLMLGSPRRPPQAALRTARPSAFSPPRTHTPALGGRSPDPTKASGSGPARCPAAGHTQTPAAALAVSRRPSSRARWELSCLLFSSCFHPCFEPLGLSRGSQQRTWVSRGQHPAQSQPRPVGWRGPSAPLPPQPASDPIFLCLTPQTLMLLPCLPAKSHPGPGLCFLL